MGYIVAIIQNISFTKPNCFLTMGEYVVSSSSNCDGHLKLYFPGFPQDTERG